MLYKVIGEPISIVRYILNWQQSKITSLEYRTADKDFKILSSVDINTHNLDISLEGFRDGTMYSYPIGSLASLSLDSYKHIFEQKVKHANIMVTPALKIIKNNTDGDKIIDIPFGIYEMQVPLPAGCNAVYYLDHVTIFDAAHGVEVARYYVYEDGIYELASDVANFTYINISDGRSTGYFSLEDFLSHEEVVPSLRYIAPISKIPTKLIDETGADISLFYDTYGLMKKMTDEREIRCYYTPEYKDESKGLRIRESVHHLVYDNFDFSQHYYNTRKAVAEAIKINDTDYEMEYIRVIYDKVEQIKESNQYEFREQNDFYATVDRYFRY